MCEGLAYERLRLYYGINTRFQFTNNTDSDSAFNLCGPHFIYLFDIQGVPIKNLTLIAPPFLGRY